jgi:hypothetical protein
MKMYLGSGGVSLRFHSFLPSEVSGQLHAHDRLTTEKMASNFRLGGPQSRSGCGGEEKKITDSSGNRTPVQTRGWSLH